MGTPLRVLIVEDSEDDAALLLRELERGGYEPTFERVDTPEGMNTALDKQIWDIVISDYVMPQFSGLAALKLLQEKGLDLPFIIVSGKIEEETAIEAMKAGAHDYIFKNNFRRLVPSIKKELREVIVRQERKRLEEEFRQSQKMETVGQLAGGIAHDFNNLLTAIKGYANFAKDALPSGDPIREDIQEVLNAAERAANLTRQLLTFSRRQIISPRVINLNELILNIDNMLRHLIAEDIELVTIPKENLGLVKVDPGQMEQVIVNLVINARDAMPEGGKLIIETQNVHLDEDYVRQHLGTTPGDYIMLAISDTGSGMSEEVKAHIFEPFFTTKEIGKGSGLGLATVYGIVKQHHGNIFVYSEIGKGTTVKIYLPQAEEKEEDLSRHSETEHLPKGNETVLAVEDEPSVRNVAVRILSKLGYTVLEASHGDETLQVAREHTGEIHLLLTDVVMPRMSGKELADRLRMIHPEIRVLFVSGYTENIITHRGILDKEVHFLQKPFTQRELAFKVREVLDTQKKEQR